MGENSEIKKNMPVQIAVFYRPVRASSRTFFCHFACMGPYTLLTCMGHR